MTGISPYEQIASIIEDWCERNYYNCFVVTLKLDGETTTQFLEFDGNLCEFIWLNDWWEGQKTVELIGFRPLCDLKVIGYPEEAKKDGKLNDGT